MGLERYLATVSRNASRQLTHTGHVNGVAYIGTSLSGPGMPDTADLPPFRGSAEVLHLFDVEIEDDSESFLTHVGRSLESRAGFRNTLKQLAVGQRAMQRYATDTRSSELFAITRQARDAGASVEDLRRIYLQEHHAPYATIVMGEVATKGALIAQLYVPAFVAPRTALRRVHELCE